MSVSIQFDKGVRPQVVSIAVGNRVLRFEPADPSVTCVVLGIAESFVVDSSHAPDCVVTCEFGDPAPDASPIVADAFPIWELRYRVRGDEEVTFFIPHGDVRTPFAQLVIDASRTTARMIRRSDDAADVFRIGFPLDEFLMCRLVTDEGALVVHGATVEYGGRALLFLGHSGAGKSTMAGLAREYGARVLSDDRSIVRIDADRAAVWGTPWHGSLRAGTPASARLAAIFLLVQSLEDRTEIISPSRGAGELLVRLIYPGASASDFERLLDCAIELALRVPMAELHFRPTTAAFRLAEEFGR